MSHDHDDFAGEPVPGLPARLPEGEQILWQGAPSAWGLAQRVFHVRAAALYFLLLMGYRAWVRLDQGGDPAAALAAFVSLLPIALVGLGLLYGLARLSSRTSVYTITNRRVVMRVGIALPTAINIPFAQITAADVRLAADGSGDIALRLAGDARVAYAALWPHVRPWRWSRPEPLLRAIDDLTPVADLLSEALCAALPTNAAQRTPAPACGVIDRDAAVAGANVQLA